MHGRDRFAGDLQLGAGRDFRGWCRAPDAAQNATVWVEVFADDRLALVLPAIEKRPELSDNCGFSGELSEAVLPQRPEVLVWARGRGSLRAFGQRLLLRPGVAAPEEPRVRALAFEFAAASSRLAALCERPPDAGARLRAAFGTVARGLGAPEAFVKLPFVRRPAASLLLPVAADPGPARRCLLRLAGILGAADAEMVALDAGYGPALALWPARIPNLVLGVAGITGITAERVVLLDPEGEPEADRVLAVLACPDAMQWRPAPGVALVAPARLLAAAEDLDELRRQVRRT